MSAIEPLGEAKFWMTRTMARGLIVTLAMLPQTAGALPIASVSPMAVFGSWSVHCPQASARTAYCEIVQRVKDAMRTGQAVLQFSLSCNSRQRLCAVQLELPPSLIAGEGALLFLDAELPLELPIQNCDRSRCSASGILPSRFGEEIIHAKQVKVQFRDQRAGRQDIALGMHGLPEAFDDMINRNTLIAGDGWKRIDGEGKTQ